MTHRASDARAALTARDVGSEAIDFAPERKALPLYEGPLADTPASHLNNALQLIALATYHEVDLFVRWGRTAPGQPEQREYRDAQVWEVDLDAIRRRLEAAVQLLEQEARDRRDVMSMLERSSAEILGDQADGAK